MPKKKRKFFLHITILILFATVFAASGLAEVAYKNLLSLISGINVNKLSLKSAKSVKYLNADMIRLDSFGWDIVEKKKGVYDYKVPDAAVSWARKNDFRVLGIIQYAPGWANGRYFKTPDSVPGCGIPDLSRTDTSYNRLRTYPPLEAQDFGNYAYQLAKKYPDIIHWQVWNEPNNPIFWPSGPNAEEYAKILKAAYYGIKEANPNAQVVLGGISLNDFNYLRKLYEAGARPYFDKMAVHLYNPLMSPSQYLENEIKDLHNLMEVYDDGKKEIWLTEIGWYTGSSAASVNEEQQASFMKELFDVVKDNKYIGAVFWHTLMDCDANRDASNPEHNYGIFKGNLDPKKAASVMRGVLLSK